jgi:hypothetical protein
MTVTATNIPVLDVPLDKEPAVFSANAEQERLSLLISSARRTYTPVGFIVAERLSRAWAQRGNGPYAAAVQAVDRLMGRRGAFLLNHSYEWGCTSGAVADPAQGGTTLLRTLDWPFDGLGRTLVVTRWDGGAGGYFSVTWPGLVGVLTGLAPGRFAIAINQPPLPLPGWGRAVGWPAARVRVARSRALSPTHLLRQVFDRCASFAEAVAAIRSTPLCIPAIFTLAGPRPGEAIVIERTMADAFVPVMPVAANHWSSQPGPAGRPRNASSRGRHAAMCTLSASAPDWSLDWCQAPLMQPDTRLAVMANPGSGRLLARGWEKAGPVTTVLDTAWFGAVSKVVESCGGVVSGS